MTQLARLSDYEARADEAVKDVNLGIERFASVLKEIKDLGLYRGQHETFEDYCRERWGRSLRTVQRALKAHDTRQKLLAAAPEAEKPHIQKASAAAILETGKGMDHLVIGRKQPTATKLSDFYGSNEPLSGAISVQESEGQIAQRVLLAFLEKQPEEHRDYLRWVAQEIAK